MLESSSCCRRCLIATLDPACVAVEPEIEGINHSDRLRSNAHASISQSSSGSQSAALHASSKMSSSQSSVSLSSNDMHTNGFDQHSHLARQPPDAVAKSHKLGSSGTVNQDCSIHPAAVAAEGLTAAQQPAQQPDTQPPQHQPASQEDTPAGPLPMLASACPGWVCYAEKTHGSYILPYISTTKSPQVGGNACLVMSVVLCRCKHTMES